ncbi:MAG TPA: hypothetical protein VIT88_10205 [Pyrinomonadaceae bacterium]
MPQRLNTTAAIEAARSTISDLIATHPEWFCTPGDETTYAVGRNELEFSIANCRLVLNSWSEKGSRVWKIYSWEWSGEKLLLQASRRMGAERPLIELVPRASAAALAVTVRTARQARCDQLAHLACSLAPQLKVERASLSPGPRRGQPGPYARIILWQKNHRIAVTGYVMPGKASDADACLAAALLWFQRTAERSRAPYIDYLWLMLEGPVLKPLIQRIALLRQSLRDAIKVYKVDRELLEASLVVVPAREELWRKRLTRFPPVNFEEDGELTKQLAQMAPEAIDVVHARHGKTLRYHGLPFARIRQVLGCERAWFGLEGRSRKLLEESSETEWLHLIRMLQEHRSASAADHYHALYRNAGEAWLESLLRRDITRLDPGLIIAPLYAQFRISRAGVPGVRPIDLLALRRDGRLTVIELKIFESREHVLQGVDYWQRVESHRRRGNIARTRLFGDRKIKNEPPLIYLVAPTLRVHPSLTTMAHAIAPDLEIYRFDINEDWRAGVRVMRRMRINGGLGQES